MQNDHLYSEQDKSHTEEVLAEPPVNKTLFITKLTELSIRPEAVYGLKNIQHVFKHYKPSCTCKSLDAYGNSAALTVSFESIEDFSPDRIISRAPRLREMKLLEKQLTEMKEKLLLNTGLPAMMPNAEAKQELLGTLRLLIDELASTY